jgi:hypothetical protein
MNCSILSGRRTMGRLTRNIPAGRLRRLMAAGQGSYYLTSGVWPLLHMPSFEFVTGPKRDRWLVKTVGVLVAISGTVQLRAAGREVSDDVRLLSVGSAVGLAAIDIVYWRKGVISAVYLLDAAAELALVGGWLVSDWGSSRRDAPASPVGPAKA